MKKTVAFIRVSTDQQDTISQENSIKEYCAKNKIIIDEWIKENGVSGFKIPIEDRKGLQYIKELALNNELDSLIVFNSDRIIRQTEGSMYLKLLASCGVKIISVTEGQLYNNDIDELLSFIRFYQAQTESKKISNRIKAGKAVAYESGKYQGGRYINFGYKLVNGKLEIDEKEATVVKKIFELYNTSGMKYVLSYLENNNITKRGNTWKANSIWQLLTNSIYYGQRQSKHNIPYDESLAIISKETWQYTQDLLNNRKTVGTTKHTNKSQALLEGLFYHSVGEDEHKLYVDYSYNGKYKHLIYRCSKCKFDRQRPKGIKYSYSGNKYHKIIENEIQGVLSNLSTDKLENEYCKRKALELTIIQVKIDDVTDLLNKKKLALTNGNNLLEKAFIGEINADVSIISNKIKELQSDIVELEMKINNLDTELHKKEVEQMNKNKLLEKYKDFNYLWNIADDEKKKAILNELVDKIIISQDNDIKIKLNI